jgi:arylsulfatase A-like enzyme
MYGGYERVAANQTVIAEPFDDAGYDTAGFHSNLYLSADFGYDRGFDCFFDSKVDENRSPTQRLKSFVKSTLDEDGLLFQTLSNMVETAERQVGVNLGLAYVPATDLTDMAVEWIREQDNGDNFLWIHYMDVHHPYVPPPEHQLPFREEPISERRAIKLRRKLIEYPDTVTDAELSDLIDLYDAEIRYTDAQIDRLLSAINDNWDRSETLVAVTADHGEEFYDHGGVSHSATFYDEVIHVPLVVDAPGIEGQYNDLVGLLDIAPTLVDYANLEVPDSYHGYSLRSLLADEVWDRTEVIGDWEDLDTGEVRLAVRTDEWKYIQRNTGPELYDLDADPNEQDNIVDEYSDIVDEFEVLLNDHCAAVASTEEDIGSVEMEESVKERLRELGYKE